MLRTATPSVRPSALRLCCLGLHEGDVISNLLSPLSSGRMSAFSSRGANWARTLCEPQRTLTSSANGAEFTNWIAAKCQRSSSSREIWLAPAVYRTPASGTLSGGAQVTSSSFGSRKRDRSQPPGFLRAMKTTPRCGYGRDDDATSAPLEHSRRYHTHRPTPSE